MVNKKLGLVLANPLRMISLSQFHSLPRFMDFILLFGKTLVTFREDVL